MKVFIYGAHHLQVVYVSGRKRAPGEMNGKSGNINNCCSQIYPKGTKIPPNEVVCIFDADQASCTPQRIIVVVWITCLHHVSGIVS